MHWLYGGFTVETSFFRSQIIRLCCIILSCGIITLLILYYYILYYDIIPLYYRLVKLGQQAKAEEHAKSQKSSLRRIAAFAAQFTLPGEYI